MNQYTYNDIQIRFSYDDQLPIEVPYAIASDDIYDARIIYNCRCPQYILLYIYYTQAQGLYDKLTYLREDEIDILKGIKTPTSGNPSILFPELLDFSNSKLIKIEDCICWELNKKPVILTIENLDLILPYSSPEENTFQLTENALLHIEEYIGYENLGLYNQDKNLIASNKNRVISWGNIGISLSINHNYGDNTDKYSLTILRDAYLIITDCLSTLSYSEIIERGKLLCLLMSFYWEKTIDFFIARVKINNIPNYRTREVHRYSKHYVDEDMDYLLKERYLTFYDFIEDLDYEKVNAHSSLLYEIVPRIIKAKYVDEISEFMILYNVIEKIRNYCIENPINGNKLVIRDEFQFTVGKTGIHKFIRDKIKAIAVKVKAEDAEEFKKKASNKVTFIKKRGLIDQFDSLVTFLGLQTSEYNIDFEQLIKIRNKIYHGNNFDEDIQSFSREMRLLINDLIFELIQ